MSGRRSSGGRAETAAEKAQRKRREAEERAPQSSEGRTARVTSRSTGGINDGLADVASSGKRRATEQAS